MLLITLFRYTARNLSESTFALLRLQDHTKLIRPSRPPPRVFTLQIHSTPHAARIWKMAA